MVGTADAFNFRLALDGKLRQGLQQLLALYSSASILDSGYEVIKILILREG